MVRDLEVDARLPGRHCKLGESVLGESTQTADEAAPSSASGL
jgi:hypothetical protein